MESNEQRAEGEDLMWLFKKHLIHKYGFLVEINMNGRASFSLYLIVSTITFSTYKHNLQGAGITLGNKDISWFLNYLLVAGGNHRGKKILWRCGKACQGLWREDMRCSQNWPLCAEWFHTERRGGGNEKQTCQWDTITLPWSLRNNWNAIYHSKRGQRSW